MSLLPQEILPQNTPLGRIDQRTGKVLIEHNWWLLIYNLCAQSLGATLDETSLLALQSVDDDAVDSDAVSLRQQLSALALQDRLDPDPIQTDASSTLLAMDGLLPDPTPRAQPVASITVGASPYVYTAPTDGTVSITSGTVSSVTITRQGTIVATGMTAGLFPLRRLDQLTVVYTVLPTLVFLP